MADPGRGRLNVETELDPMPEADEERLEVEQLVPDGLEDEANVAEYNDDDQEVERRSLDDFAEEQIIG